MNHAQQALHVLILPQTQFRALLVNGQRLEAVHVTNAHKDLIARVLHQTTPNNALLGSIQMQEPRIARNVQQVNIALETVMVL